MDCDNLITFHNINGDGKDRRNNFSLKIDATFHFYDKLDLQKV